MSWAKLRSAAKVGEISPRYRENETPSAIAYDPASSDDGLGDDTTGGLSKVGSFSDDPAVEIMRLKALLSQREDELAEKNSLLAQREGLLGQSKGARTNAAFSYLCMLGRPARVGRELSTCGCVRAEIIDRLIQENDALKKAAGSPRAAAQPAGPANRSAASSPTHSPRARAVPAPAAARRTVEQPSARSATVKSLVSQQEATSPARRRWTTHGTPDLTWSPSVGKPVHTPV